MIKPNRTARMTSPTSFAVASGSIPCADRAANATATTRMSPGRIESSVGNFKGKKPGSVVVAQVLLGPHPQAVGLRLEQAAALHLAAVDVEGDGGPVVQRVREDVIF